MKCICISTCIYAKECYSVKVDFIMLLDLQQNLTCTILRELHELSVRLIPTKFGSVYRQLQVLHGEKWHAVCGSSTWEQGSNWPADVCTILGHSYVLKEKVKTLKKHIGQLNTSLKRRGKISVGTFFRMFKRNKN